MNAGDYKFKQIASEKLLIVVTSTQGKPPEEAVALHKFLFSKAPKLENTAFAVFSLGDSSYEFSASPGKILTVSWRNWAVNACSTVSMPTLNTGLLPASGAPAWLMRLNRVRLSRHLRNPSLLAR